MMSAEKKAEPAIADELLTELKSLRNRFVRCMEYSGTATEYALAAVASADALIAKAEGK